MQKMIAAQLTAAALIFVMAANVCGQRFSVLHAFSNGDGSQPFGGVVLSGSTLYGTTRYGGANGSGTVYAVNTNGTGFTNLYNFTAHSGSGNPTNTDGAFPTSKLVVSGNTLYGTALAGGLFGNGTLFKLNTDGTGFTVLHTFSANFSSSGYSNADGAGPWGGMVLQGQTLYGTTAGGGSWNGGTVFSIQTDGTGFTNLHSLFGTTDGSDPVGGLILSDGPFTGPLPGRARGCPGRFSRSTPMAELLQSLRRFTHRA